MKGAVGKISSSDDNVEATDETTEATNQISPPSPKKGRRKKLNGKKYEQIEDLEEKAFQLEFLPNWLQIWVSSDEDASSMDEEKN